MCVRRKREETAKLRESAIVIDFHKVTKQIAIYNECTYQNLKNKGFFYIK